MGQVSLAFGKHVRERVCEKYWRRTAPFGHGSAAALLCIDSITSRDHGEQSGANCFQHSLSSSLGWPIRSRVVHLSHPIHSLIIDK